MFFFFVGGVEQEVSKVIKAGAGRCINCGSVADLVEYEKVLKMFFFPVWWWPGKDPTMYCKNCLLIFSSFAYIPTQPNPIYKDWVIEPVFNFCPFCSLALNSDPTLLHACL
uniref:Zinc-ribbon 15 domain-containing protein n=1 Tax=Nelumbo nucifera TaxID=4432 RepID=A0A822YU46_NELNU|nr:TPA_asm: hypothetical protein HUJ06_006670 [Nelumbo nucifera]